MATKLNLKAREADSTVSLPGKAIKEIVVSGDKEALWNSVKNIAELDFSEHVHDKQWMVMIARWQPQKGVSLKNQYRAMKLIDRLDDIDDSENVEFEISDKDKEFIIDQLRNDEFKPSNMPIQFIRFIFDLEDQLDHHIISPEKDIE